MVSWLCIEHRILPLVAYQLQQLRKSANYSLQNDDTMTSNCRHDMQKNIFFNYDKWIPLKLSTTDIIDNIIWQGKCF
jgi:hypothetical protein